MDDDVEEFCGDTSCDSELAIRLGLLNFLCSLVAIWKMVMDCSSLEEAEVEEEETAVVLL